MRSVTWVRDIYVVDACWGNGLCRVGGSDGYHGEQGVPVGIQECLEGFHLGCIDYLGRQFVPKWDSPNGEDELVTARTVSLFA